MSLFKRITGKNADGTPIRSEYWTYKFKWRGRQIPRSTLFKNKADALRAMQNHRLDLERDWSENGPASTLADDHHRRRRAAGHQNTMTTVGEILEAFLDPRAPLEAKLKTRIACANALRNALRRVFRLKQELTERTERKKTPSSVLSVSSCSKSEDDLSVSVINAEFVETYFAQAITRTNALTDQAQVDRVKRTAASVLHQGLSVFVAAAQRYYRKLGLQMPDLEAVRQAVKECRFARVSRHEYVAAPESVITATLAAWEQLDNRDIFLVVGHALAFGLRKAEIGQARWGWHVQQAGQPFISTAGANVKDQSGRLTIRGLNPFYEVMMKRTALRGWRGKPDEFIVQGTEYFRTWQVFNLANAWLRAMGWETQKGLHALRDYAGSQVALLEDIYSASIWLRHKSVAVTQQSYSSYVSQAGRSNRGTLKVSWA